LRDDLPFSIQEQGAKQVCIIEDPVLSRFFRIGLEEYCFLRELDGKQTVTAILTRLAQRGGGQTFSESEALEVLHWLRQNDLLAVASNVTNKHQNELKIWKSALWLNPLMVRIPLARPDKFFAWLAAKVRIFSRAARLCHLARCRDLGCLGHRFKLGIICSRFCWRDLAV
jgi:putative peptide zinc metalloprotease protein